MIVIKSENDIQIPSSLRLKPLLTKTLKALTALLTHSVPHMPQLKACGLWPSLCVPFVACKESTLSHPVNVQDEKCFHPT